MCAQRRMFSLQIADTDAFLCMPSSAQNLYFHLGLRADDDGFVASPKKIASMCNASEDDMKILVAKRFILIFESGIVVIKHWRVHNYIQNDRYHETKYIKERRSLRIRENGSYTDKNDENSFSLNTEFGQSNQKVLEPPIPSKTSDQLWEEMISAFSNTLAPSMVIEFENHWRAKNPNGTKERWQMEKVFDMSRRLDTWKRRDQKWTQNQETRKELKNVNEKPAREDRPEGRDKQRFSGFKDIIK